MNGGGDQKVGGEVIIKDEKLSLNLERTRNGRIQRRRGNEGLINLNLSNKLCELRRSVGRSIDRSGCRLVNVWTDGWNGRTRVGQ